MSKRKNSQLKRRQIRRALNNSTVKQISPQKAMSVGYGSGLTSNKFEEKYGKEENSN